MQELSQQSLPLDFNPSWECKAAWHKREKEVAESPGFEWFRNQIDLTLFVTH